MDSVRSRREIKLGHAHFPFAILVTSQKAQPNVKNPFLCFKEETSRGLNVFHLGNGNKDALTCEAKVL
jgi:predicted FMN-binding regulatory protein PaiB